MINSEHDGSADGTRRRRTQQHLPGWYFFSYDVVKQFNFISGSSLYLQAGQQLAQQLAETQPDLVEQLRGQFEASNGREFVIY